MTFSTASAATIATKRKTVSFPPPGNAVREKVDPKAPEGGGGLKIWLARNCTQIRTRLAQVRTRCWTMLQPTYGSHIDSCGLPHPGYGS